MSTAETESNNVEPLEEGSSEGDVGTGEDSGEAGIPADLDLRVEAALLTTDRPQTAGKLAQLLGPCPSKTINEAVERLNATYVESGRSFRIEKIAGGWQLMTLAEYGDVLSTMHRSRAQAKLSPAALETLAIVGYKQPVLRADVEAIRGVASGEVLRSLMDRRLIKIAGRAEVIGRPILYGTTKAFLQVFGLSSIKDLPKVEEMVAPPVSPPISPPASPPAAPPTSPPASTDTSSSAGSDVADSTARNGEVEGDEAGESGGSDNIHDVIDPNLSQDQQENVESATSERDAPTVSEAV